MTPRESESGLVVRLFGAFELLKDGSPLPRTRTRKEQWLLALLILRREQAVDRAWLAGTLWPDSTENQALENLRRSLHNLRRVLGPDAVRINSPTTRSVRFQCAGAAVDLLDFDNACSEQTEASLSRATDLRRGELLAGCDEEWLVQERSDREERYGWALESLARLAQERRDARSAVRWLRQLLAADPLNERAQASLMRALASSGDHAGVVQAYRAYRLLIHAELQTEPSASLVSLYKQLRDEARGARSLAVARQCELRPAIHGPRIGRALPVPITPLIGREPEVAELLSLLGSSRAVTLTGAGGVGKTRLAIAVAAAIEADFPGGVRFVDLVAVSGASPLEQQVATALGVSEANDATVSAAILRFLESRALLLVLDNCEHLIGACSHLAEELLTGCGRLTLLATSRQPLRISGERVWRVPPLACPVAVQFAGDLTHTIPHKEVVAELMEFAAVRLFAERAASAERSFRLTPRNALAVAHICERLDGIPLAIELAAARVVTLTADEILSRLHDQFVPLQRPPGDAARRQQTLQTTLAWSYRLLNEDERTMLDRLSVFSGPFALAAVSAVCAEPDWAALQLLASLVEKSLVLHESVGPDSRYRLLETVRQYAAARLESLGQSAFIRSRHRDHFLNMASVSERDWHSGMVDLQWASKVLEDAENFRLALDWCSLEPDGAEKQLALAIAMAPFWEAYSYFREGRERLTEALARAAGDALSQERANALSAMARLATRQGDYGEAEARHSQARAIRLSMGDVAGAAWNLNGMATVAALKGDFELANRQYQDALEIHRGLGNEPGVIDALASLGMVARCMGDFALSRRDLGEALRSARRIGGRVAEAICLHNLGVTLQEEGELVAGRDHFEQALAINRDLGNRGRQAENLFNLGVLAFEIDRSVLRARAFLDESLALSRELGKQPNEANVLEALARIALTEGQFREAALLNAESLKLRRQLGLKRDLAYGLATAAVVLMRTGRESSAAVVSGAEAGLRQALSAPRDPATTAAVQELEEQIRAYLGDEAFERCWRDGRSMTADEAVEYVVQAASDV